MLKTYKKIFLRSSKSVTQDIDMLQRFKEHLFEFVG